MSTEVNLRLVEKISFPAPEKGLVPLAMKKSPAGSIKVAGWLKRQMELALGGLPGQLWKTSDFLQESNGWLKTEELFPRPWKGSSRPWEEQPYFLRTLIYLAIHTGDAEALNVAERYLKIMLASREPDGWFGPQALKYASSEDPEDKRTMHDLWPHMIICEGVLAWYEYTKDPAYLEMLRCFCHFCLNTSDEEFIPPTMRKGFSWHSTIQYVRACDMLPVLCKVIELTGDETLLPLIHRFYRSWKGPEMEFMSRHTVNFSQLFAYPAYYSRLVPEKWLRESAHYWYDQHINVWGTLPRGVFCADENARRGCTDPRYGTESCTFGEFARSFMYLEEMNMEPIWADRTEDILFNHYPAAYTKDMKKVHYITCSNHVMLDDYTAHNVANRAHMFAYTDTRNRCCLHNAGLAWMVFASYMLTQVYDGGLCACLHGPYTAETTAGKENIPVRCTSKTDYPFRERITFTLEPETAVEFPFYIRIPRWCAKPELALNGQKIPLEEKAQGKFLVLERRWCPGDTVELYFPSEITLSENSRNGGVTVDKGPFSYSLQIPEITSVVVSSRDPGNPVKEHWNEKNAVEGDIWTELLPGSAWNYGLQVEEGFSFEERPLPEEFPFFWETPPMVIKARGKKIPSWKLQDHMCAELQQSPVKSAEKSEELTLIPLGCARLRLSVFPVVSDSEWAAEWKEVPESTDIESRPKIRE